MKLLLSFFTIAITFISLNNITHAQSSGKWGIGQTDARFTGTTLFYAATNNDSGHLLGQYCSSSNCVWMLGMNLSCEEGAQYPIIANTDQGAIPLYVQCNAQLNNSLYRYVFSDFDTINTLITKASRVGFAFPLATDEFRVIRFDLNGSNRAIAAMHSEAQGSGTRDSRY